MVFKNLCTFVLWAKVAPALEGLSATGMNEIKYTVFIFCVLTHSLEMIPCRLNSTHLHGFA